MDLIDERRKIKRLKRSEQKDQKMHQRQEMIKHTRKTQRILEEFKGIRNISNIKSAKKRILIPMKTEKGDVITSRKGIANVFGEFYSKLYDDDQYDETELETDTNETENDKGDQSVGVEETKEIPEVTIEELHAAIDRLKRKSRRQQRNQSRRHQNMRRRDKRNGEADLQRSAKTKRMHTRGMAKNENKTDKQKGDVEEDRNYPHDLYSTSVVHIVFNAPVQQALLQA